MARKVFPSNPNTNDIFTSTKGKKFQWNGKVWKRTQDTNVESMTLDSSADEKLALHGSDNPTIRFREGSTDKGNLHWKASTGQMRLVNEESSEELRLGSSGLELTCGIIPDSDDAYDLGTSSKQWRNLHVDGTGNIDTIQCTNLNGSILTIGGSSTLGDASSDTITANGRFDSDLVPSSDGANALGATALRWSALFADAATITNDVSVGGDLSVIGNMDVTGTLTYEDVTNIDSVGVVTARSGLVVSSGGANITGGITGDLTGNVTGNADTATTLETSRNLSLAGDATGSTSFDGSDNAIITATLANSGVTAGTYGSSSAIPAITVNAKGLITSASTTAIDSTSIANGTSDVSVASDSDVTVTTAGSLAATFDTSQNLTVVGTVTAQSSIALKDNVETISDALSKVLNLRGVEFDYKANGRHSIGVVAEEVENVFDCLVVENDGVKSVAYQNLTAVLIEAVKELTSQVDKLKTELNTLKG
jgi:hypothetical protein